MTHLERYGRRADPEFTDGDGAESFSTLLQRAEAALDRLLFHPTADLVYVFSHGQFIEAIRSLVIDTPLSDKEKMRKFWGKGRPAIANAERFELQPTAESAGMRLPIGGEGLA